MVNVEKFWASIGGGVTIETCKGTRVTSPPISRFRNMQIFSPGLQFQTFVSRYDLSFAGRWAY